MSGEVTLEQVLALVPEEGHAIHIYDREWPDAAEPQQMARHILQVRQKEDFK